jgi:hypothetical protein
VKQHIPLRLETGITTEIYNYIRLAVILAHEDSYPWFVERFIQLYIDLDHFSTDYYLYNSLEAITLYNEVLCVTPLDCRGGAGDMVKGELEKGCAVQLYIDKYYVPGNRCYHTRHFLHELLIPGYDDDAGEFSFVDLNIHGSLTGIHTMSMEELKAGWQSACEQIKDWKEDLYYTALFFQLSFPAASFRYVKDRIPHEPDLSVIYCTLKKWYEPGELHCMYDGTLLKKKWGGDVYKVYYEDLINLLGGKGKDLLKEKWYILLGMKRLIENRLGLQFRINYLFDHGYLPGKANDPGKTIIQRIKELVDTLGIAVNLLTKFSFVHRNELLEEAREKLRAAEVIDREVTEGFLELLYSVVHKRFIGPCW